MGITPKPVSPEIVSRVSQYLGVPIAKIEDKHPDFASSISNCECGKELDFFDFVKTAFNHGIHSKQYMAEFFDSDKSMNREMDTTILCSVCDRAVNTHVLYKYSGPHTCS